MSSSRSSIRSSLLRAFSAAALLVAAGCDSEAPTDVPLETAAGTLEVVQGILASATPTELFISEYIEGSSNNKALEIFNGTGAPVDLGAAGYDIQMFFNGNSNPGLTISLSGTVASGDVFVLAQSSADPLILAEADQTNGAGWFNGDDAVVLRRGGVIVDAIGQIGVDPGTQWGTGATSTQDNTLRRRADVCTGDADATDPFDPAVEWEGFATNTFDGLGSHVADCDDGDAAPSVISTSPAAGASDVPVDADIILTFSEPVDVTGDWFEIICTVSGTRTATVSGGPTVFTLDPDADFTGGESCTVTVRADGVADQDSIDPPDAPAADFSFTFATAVIELCGAPYTPIFTIQGSGATTPLAGSVVSTEGVVVGDFEGSSPALRGFYLQDPDGDGDETTSDAIFVFNGNDDDVSLGDRVRVRGTAQEFQGQTQLGGVQSLLSCGTGTVDPVEVTLPFPSADYLERFEGMLVRFPQTLYVTEHVQLGRFGQVVLSSSGRLFQPTNVALPGAPAAAVQAANDLNRIILDDAENRQNPDPIVFGGGSQPLSASNTLRGGDKTTGITGVLTWTWAGNSASGNAWRVRPLGSLGGTTPEFLQGNPRPMTPPRVGGSLTVASLNVLNYFNTFSGCTNGVGGASTSCRGADNATEFERQSQKTVAALAEMDAAVVGLVEIENDGYGPGSALAELVDRLNVATAPGRYAFIDVDSATGEVNALGTDAIKVALIYQPARVTPVGQTAALNSVAFVNGGDPARRNRPSLAQAFQQGNGARFVVSVNHFKSKGSACGVPDAGDGQGNCNAVRVAAANELRAWLDSDPTGTGDPDVLILGDLNAYALEDPIRTLTGAGYKDLFDFTFGRDGYTYVFNGQWGTLDHALVSPSLYTQVTGLGVWHVNADEPSVLDYNTNFKSPDQLSSLFAPDRYRNSDHDPVIVGLELEAPPSFAFTGFLFPIQAFPGENVARAGLPLLVRFGLGGPQGLDVFAPGFPRIVPATCGGDATGTEGKHPESGLFYNRFADRYALLVQTEREWSGSCQDLLVRFVDGTETRARFRFR
jgi:uncharacterized protein